MTDGKGPGMAGRGSQHSGGGDLSAGNGVPEKRQEYRYDGASKKGAGDWKNEGPGVAPEFGGSPFSQPFEQSKPFDDRPLDQVGKTSTMPEAFEDKDVIEDKETDESQKAPIGEDIKNEDHFDPSTEETGTEEVGSMQYEKMDPLSSGFPPGSSVEVADVSGASGQSGIEVQNDSTSFLGMMREAGITKKHIFMVLGVFGFVVAVVLFFIFGGYKIFTGGSAEDNKVPAVIEESAEELSEELTVVENKEEVSVPAKEPVLKDVTIPPSFDQVFALSGLVNSYIFGLEFSKYSILQGLNTAPVSSGGSMVGVEASFAVGKSAEVNKNSITYYTDLLRKIDEARKINLYDYLNKFVDRRKALQDHLVELNQLVMEAESNRNAILQELERINAEYTAVGEQKNVFEKGFFDSLNSYHGEGAYDNLELFVEASQRQIKDKAYYNTLKTLSDMFASAISALSPRIQDISVNAEALIKGVRVFEVQGSNIDAIIIQNSAK